MPASAIVLCTGSCARGHRRRTVCGTIHYFHRGTYVCRDVAILYYTTVDLLEPKRSW